MALAPAKHGLNRSGAAAKMREISVNFCLVDRTLAFLQPISNNSRLIGQMHTHPGRPGIIAGISTAGIRPAERMDFWHQAHLGHVTLSKAGEEVRSFEGRVRRIHGAHLMEHASDALIAVRDQQQWPVRARGCTARTDWLDFLCGFGPAD